MLVKGIFGPQKWDFLDLELNNFLRYWNRFRKGSTYQLFAISNHVAYIAPFCFSRALLRNHLNSRNHFPIFVELEQRHQVTNRANFTIVAKDDVKRGGELLNGTFFKFRLILVTNHCLK